MSADWSANGGKREGMALGHIAVLCLGGVMDGEYVEAAIGTQFFRKASREAIQLASGYCPDIPIHSYRFTRQSNGIPVFRLEEQW